MTQQQCECGSSSWTRNRSCGVWVCDNCEHHLGLVRCYCGWSADGGDGREQLEDMGETIDPEDY